MTRDDINQIQKLLEANNEKLRDYTRQEIQASEKSLEKRLSAKIDSAKEELKNDITREVRDLAEINSELIREVENHRQRIERLEDVTGITPLKQ